MMNLIDPHPAPRNKRLKPKPFAKLLAKQSTPKALQKSERNLARLDWLCEQLLHTSVRMLLADIWARYHGNIAADATLIPGTGRPNPTDKGMRRGNADPHSGRYRRGGKHDGQGAKTDKAGYELEISVMVWDKPGQNTVFPSLITAVGFHRPGEIIGSGVRLLDSHQRRGFTSGLVIVDRAYNGEKPRNFHIPVRQRGCELVIDYKKPDLGLQNQWRDLILVDGNWYVTWMPQDLIDAAKNYNTRVSDPPQPREAQATARQNHLPGLPRQTRCLPNEAERAPRQRRIPAFHVSHSRHLHGNRPCQREARRQTRHTSDRHHPDGCWSPSRTE
ncbi:hypothetical protein E3O62_10995 [Cryobacterium sp. TMT2-15-1]|uniref:hypothetical protein n=1 Tax=Cryobacterium sp. TMT2-15-1 TaxID=1259246 RepID=UPI001069C8F0|nr:hypothetical protein [Cryobacterium sp. TMT2-15-1]TFC58028.1 hypothetical protein E3O62_10995 [Cryobacterium sp. TMT2-15-1]